jgi:hypothetical protein
MFDNSLLNKKALVYDYDLVVFRFVTLTVVVDPVKRIAGNRSLRSATINNDSKYKKKRTK